MKQRWSTHLALILIVCFTTRVVAQKNSISARPQPLVLTGAIPLRDVQGRIDHFGFDPKGRLFVSALGNNTEEVIDIAAGRVVHTISGVPKPQGVVYSPESNKLYVGSDEGKLYIYDGSSWDLITSIDFGDDVDNLRYDGDSKRVYVGYGDGEAGAIGMVDATTNKRLDEEFKLGAHPESFQLESSGPNIYVNLPTLKQVAVINRSSRMVSRWPLTQKSNFPMALDEANRRLFVVTRAPASMVVLDTNSGRVVAALPCVLDSDDAYFDAARRRIYLSGGEGYVSVFQQKDADHYELLAKVSSAVGARTAGYFGKGTKGLERFL